MAGSLAHMDNINAVLDCPICLDKFTCPKDLDCHHSFCVSPCLEQLVDQSDGTITCPMCRHKHTLSSKGVGGLKVNKTLERLIKLTRNSPPSIRCDVCFRTGSIEQCLHCGKHLCATCNTRHMNEMKSDLEELVKHIQQRACIVLEAREQSPSADELRSQVRVMKSHLYSATSDLISCIKRREKELEAHLERFLDSETKNIVNLNEAAQEAADVLHLCHDYSDKQDTTTSSQNQYSIIVLSDKLKNYLIDSPPGDLTISLHDLSVNFSTSDLQHALDLFGKVTISRSTVSYETISKNMDSLESEQEKKSTAHLEPNAGATEATNEEQNRSDISFDIQEHTPSDKTSSSQCVTIHEPTKLLLDPNEVGAIFGVAVCPKSGSIAATDNHSHLVKLFDEDGRFLREFGSFGHECDQLHLPYGVDFTTDGNLVVSDGKNHRIKCYDAKGNVLFCRGRFGSAFCQFINPLGLCIDRSSMFIYVCDSGNQRVQRFYENGNLAPAAWLNRINFKRPTQVCVDAEGSLYVRDNNIVRFFSRYHGFVEQPLRLLDSFGIARHKGIAVSRDGHLCIAHSDNCVYVYDEGQRLIKKIICRSADNHNTYVTDIAVTPNGKIIVAGKSFLEMY